MSIFDIAHPPIGSCLPKGWILCRPRSAMPGEVAISRKRYKAAYAKAVEARGYLRPVEIVIRDLLALVDEYAGYRGYDMSTHPAMVAGHEALKLAREP